MDSTAEVQGNKEEIINPDQDTDGDGLNDGDEVKLGLNSNITFTDGITNDSERKIQQSLSSKGVSEVISESDDEFTPSVSGQVSGVLDRNVFINAYDTTPMKNISGIEGRAVNCEYKNNNYNWRVSNNHKGFDVASTRILRCLTQYENESYLDNSAKKTYWLMGHSRGGIANIIGARLVNDSKDVYTYTFASPSTTTAGNAENTAAYPGIYNIINKVGNIMNNRNEAYVYSCKCHGNGTRDNITAKNYGMSKDSREKAIAKIPSNALQYCKITRYKFIN